MKIASVKANVVYVPIKRPGSEQLAGVNMGVCLVDVTTECGLVGTGMTGITDPTVVSTAVNEVAASKVVGLDPLRNEMIWERLSWVLSPRGQSGYAWHAISAIDLALWDLKGKALSQPCWRLLGGARNAVDLYATFGFAFMNREELVENAQKWVARGFRHLKMTVGEHALQRRDEPRPIETILKEDVARVEAVRDAIGPDINLYIDANCSLDYMHARFLALRLQDARISFFEEPVAQNDIHNLAKLRRSISIPVAAGQNEGLASRFRDMLVAEAVDVIQPNACATGGFTQCTRIAALASAFGAKFANGGGWPFHNMHLHAGLANGTLVEFHDLAVQGCRQIFSELPEPHDGSLQLTEVPGLGFEPNREAVRSFLHSPTSSD